MEYAFEVIDQRIIQLKYKLGEYVHQNHLKQAQAMSERISELDGLRDTLTVHQMRQESHAGQLHDYTVEQLSQFFGVSTITISSWLQNGRFLGVKDAKPSEEIRIPESAIWITSSGEELSIKEVVTVYEKELQSRPAYPNTVQDERKAIKDELATFEKKYGGSFEESLGEKVRQKQPLSEDEERDADEWSYWLQRLIRLKDEDA